MKFFTCQYTHTRKSIISTTNSLVLLSINCPSFGLMLPFGSLRKFWATREEWHKVLGEENASQIKEKSLLGHLLCSEVLQKKSFKNRIFFHILETEGITKIWTLYKNSSSKFILIFKSKRAIAVLETRR